MVGKHISTTDTKQVQASEGTQNPALYSSLDLLVTLLRSFD